MPRDEMRRFAGFVLTGGVAALVNLATRYAMSFVLVYEIAVAVAYLIGMTTAFLLSRHFVFKASGRSWLEEYGRFALVNAFAFAQVWLVSVGLARIVFPAIEFGWHAQDVAHFIGVASPIVTSYYGHKNFSFKVASRVSRRPSR